MIKKLEDIQNAFCEALLVEHKKGPDFIPTGLQDEIIKEFGSGKWQIITVEYPNQIGKTYSIAAIIRALILKEYRNEYFPDKIFHNWPYPKEILVTGTLENIMEKGALYKNFPLLFPEAKLHKYKDGKSSYIHRLEIADWTLHFKAYTVYKSNPKEWEGGHYGLIVCDEPPEPGIIGACTSRLSDGGIMLFTMTPINATPAIKVIEDLKEQGTRVTHITGDYRDDDCDTGKWNRLKTRRGRRTKQQLEDWAKTIPVSERDARLHGKRSGGGGVLLPKFNYLYHRKDFSLDSNYCREANHYMAMDPAHGFYPYISWWMVPRDNIAICYNEWPTYDTLGMYYDQARYTKRCKLGPDSISKIMKMLDFESQYGFKILKRVVDPFFAAGTKDHFAKKSQGIDVEYSEYGIFLELAPRERIDKQTNNLNLLIENFEPDHDISVWNHPSLYVMSHCVSMLRSLSRVSRLEGKPEIDDTYKDPFDTARYFLSVAGYPLKWIPPKKEIKKKPRRRENYDANMRNIEIG